MKVIYKYPLELREGEQSFAVAGEAKVIHIGMQGNACFVWAEVSDQNDLYSTLCFHIMYTGVKFSKYASGTIEHTTTIQHNSLVFHIYQEL